MKEFDRPITVVLNELPSEEIPPALVVYHEHSAEIIELIPNTSQTIGRDPQANISISDPALSRFHARIEIIDNQLWLTDLNSSNGTFVNGKKIKHKEVFFGDDIIVGKVAISLHTKPQHRQSNLKNIASLIEQLTEQLTINKTFNRNLHLFACRPLAQYDLSRLLQRFMKQGEESFVGKNENIFILIPEGSRVEIIKRIEDLQRLIPELRAVLCRIRSLENNAPPRLIKTIEEKLSQVRHSNPLLVLDRGATNKTIEHIHNRPMLEGEAIQRVIDLVDRVATASLPILLKGETGTGKEVIARLIHERSDRKKEKMCFINCGAIPKELVQSVLFGHEKGTFTGADQKRRGVFEQAKGSTLLLDEVGELPQEAQISLLRVLETGKVSRIGSASEEDVDVRIISATHRDLEILCDSGKFRRDLFYRLNAITIDIPPLRARKDEIISLANHFASRACQLSKRSLVHLTSEAKECLLSYQWPGNVRELRNVIERAILLSNQTEIEAIDFPEHLRAARSNQNQQTGLIHPAIKSVLDFREEVLAFQSTLIRRALNRHNGNKTLAAEELSLPIRTFMHKVKQLDIDATPTIELASTKDHSTFKAAVFQFEKELLKYALTRAQGNRTAAAKALSIAPSTLSYQLKTHQLN